MTQGKGLESLLNLSFLEICQFCKEGLDFMNAVINFISKKLPILILLVAIYTYFSPYYWDEPSIIPSIFLGIVIFLLGFQ